LRKTHFNNVPMGIKRQESTGSSIRSTTPAARSVAGASQLDAHSPLISSAAAHDRRRSAEVPMLHDRTRTAGQTDADAAASGEETLHDRGLLAFWYVRLRLEQELDRSRRAGHSLAVVLLAPNPPAGDEVSEEARAAAAAAVQSAARKADLVGWLAESVLVVMPDGDAEGSKRAAQRWKNQIWLKTMHLGAVKWEAFVVDNASWYASADEVLEAAQRGLRALLRPRGWQTSPSA
jgi:hypothetical protein